MCGHIIHPDTNNLAPPCPQQVAGAAFVLRKAQHISGIRYSGIHVSSKHAPPPAPKLSPRVL
jgi:hypothetical protein